MKNVTAIILAVFLVSCEGKAQEKKISKKSYAVEKTDAEWKSKSGWPSFDRGIQGNIEYDSDYNLGYKRTELKCNTCGGHLGHSFQDGPRATTGIRHCINSAALNFKPSKKNE